MAERAEPLIIAQVEVSNLPQTQMETEFDRRSFTVAEDAGRHIGAACGKAANYGMEFWARARRKTHDIGTSVLSRAEHWKYERPLQLLGYIAGAAAVGGIMVRVWRSGRDE